MSDCVFPHPMAAAAANVIKVSPTFGLLRSGRNHSDCVWSAYWDGFLLHFKEELSVVSKATAGTWERLRTDFHLEERETLWSWVTSKTLRSHGWKRGRWPRPVLWRICSCQLGSLLFLHNLDQILYLLCVDLWKAVPSSPSTDSHTCLMLSWGRVSTFCSSPGAFL